MIKVLNIPNIQPDEWIIGYFERLAILNGNESASQFFKNLKVNDKISFVAELLEVPTKTIIQEYTLLPLFRSIVANHADIQHGDTSNPKLIKSNGLRGYSEQVKVCPKCMDEDCGYLGNVYIRRSHQIFGANWCHKHNSELLETKQDNIRNIIQGIDPTRALPNNASPIKHPVIERFLHICDALLSQKEPIHGDRVSWVLSKRAATMGIRTSAKGSGIPLSDYANLYIPNAWLHKFFPSLSSKTPDEFLHAIDGVCVFRLQSHTPMTYILAASLLFQDPDEALNCLFAKVKIPSARPIKRRHEEFWNSEELYNLYIKHKGNCQLITKQLGGHYDTNRLNLIKHGLPPLSGLSLGTLRALSDFNNGVKLNEILSRDGVQFDNFEFVIRHSSPKFFRALNDLYEDLNKQRIALRLRLNKQQDSHVKAPSLEEFYLNEELLAMEQS